MQTTPKPDVISVQDKLPVPDRRVIVVGKRFRCLGYLGRDGVWRDDIRETELQDVVGWLEL